jgi:aromatic ring-cleaving dioxygenase
MKNVNNKITNRVSVNVSDMRENKGFPTIKPKYHIRTREIIFEQVVSQIVNQFNGNFKLW